MNVGCENCVPVFVETGEPGLFWSFKHVFHLFSHHKGASNQGQRSKAGCTLGNESEWVCASLPLLWDQHGIRRIGLTLVKSPDITYHYLFLPQRKPKACSNCIINIIAVWGPIILSLSFTCPNLESVSAPIFEHRLAMLVSAICDQSSVDTGLKMQPSSTHNSTTCLKWLLIKTMQCDVQYLIMYMDMLTSMPLCAHLHLGFHFTT